MFGGLKGTYVYHPISFGPMHDRAGILGDVIYCRLTGTFSLGHFLQDASTTIPLSPTDFGSFIDISTLDFTKTINEVAAATDVAAITMQYTRSFNEAVTGIDNFSCTLELLKNDTV